MQSPATNSKPLVAFFGATGGCCGAALARSLNAGFSCTALARTPTKLTELLLTKGVSQSTISTHLSITQGDVRDIEAVKKALSPNGETASIILSGIGIVTFGKVSICADATRTIFAALASLKPVQKPLFLGISSTGISSGPRDVPIMFHPLYKLLLARPHKDKRDMENLLSAAAAAQEQIRDFVIVRCSFMTNGPVYGEAKVRVGTEEKPEVGYTISREDVGKWIFDSVVKDEGRERWAGVKVCLTY